MSAAWNEQPDAPADAGLRLENRRRVVLPDRESAPILALQKALERKRRAGEESKLADAEVQRAVDACREVGLIVSLESA